MKLCEDEGVGGADGEGDGESTIHILWEVSVSDPET